jgi:dTMP kinase
MTEQRETTRTVDKPWGFFIAIDGIDGCGKTTQAKRLAAACQAVGLKHLLVQDPGTTEVGKELRKLLLNKELDMAAITQALLFAAARHETCKVIEEARKEGIFVIADRWTPSTIVYQGIAQGVPKELIKTLTNAPVCHVHPDLLVILNVEVSTAESRRSPDKADRFENTPNSVKQALADGFRALRAYREDDTREWRSLTTKPIDADKLGQEQVEEAIRKLMPHKYASMLPPVAIPTVTGDQRDPGTISHRLV